MKPLNLSSFDVSLWGLGLCLALAAAGPHRVQAQSGAPMTIAPGHYTIAPSAKERFAAQLSEIVPVGYGHHDAGHCDANSAACDGNSLPCDGSSSACDASGVTCDGSSLPCDATGVAGATTAGSDDIWTRTSMTNGLWGKGTALAEQGIVYDAQLTQFYQGVASGGGDQVFEYGGKLDQFIILNSKELGLWEGMQIVMHAETRFGEDVIPDAALLAPVNVNMLYPSLDNETAITGLQITQALSEEWAVTAGKINALDLFYTLYPQTGRGVDGFMNASMVLPLTLARTVPLSTVGAGIMRLHGKQPQGGILVYDSYNSATTSGFDNLFDNGANVNAFWRVFTEMSGLPGSHMLLGTYASGDFTSLDRTGWVITPGQGVVAPQDDGSWSLLYILEQKLWVDKCHEERNVGVLASWGVSEEQTSPFQWVANVAVQAQGIVPGRELDALGVGYFYNGLSGDLKQLLPVLNLADLQGVELYYNAAITPWFHLTGDLQVVEPALGTRDTALVLGLRAKLSL